MGIIKIKNIENKTRKNKTRKNLKQGEKNECGKERTFMW